MPLTDTRIRSLKPRDAPYEVSDSGGLFLEVRPSGTKSWRMRYRWGGKQPKLSFGQYPAISLARARARREEINIALQQGLDPARTLREKRLAQSPEARAASTFEGFACRWLEEQVDGKVKTDRDIRRALVKDAFPVLGKAPLAEVRAEDVFAVTDRIKQRGADQMALFTRNVMKRVFDYAVLRGYARFNPAAAVRAKFIATPKSRDRVLRPDELGKVLRALEQSSMKRMYKLAIYLLLVTLVRKSELTQARWSEIDFERKEWVIHSSRMKMGKEHVVFLSDQATDAFRELRNLAGESAYVFPSGRGRRDEPISRSTLNRLIAALNVGIEHFVPHDFRRTGSTLLHENGHRPDVIEKLLAHETGGVRGVYNRAKYSKERRELLREWANFVDDQRAAQPRVVLGKFDGRHANVR